MKLNPLVMMRKEFDNDGIVFDPEQNHAMSLNATGVFIWEALEKKLSREEIVAALTEEFDVTQETAEKDVSAFLNQLQEKGLLSLE